MEVINHGGQKIKKPYYRVVGTGVLFYVNHLKETVPVLVTAKHVFEDTENEWNPSELRLRFSWFDDKPVDEYFGFRLVLFEEGKKNWFSHSNEEVDLAGIPLNIPANLDIGSVSIKVQAYSQIATDQEIFEGASIYVLGYPGAVGAEYWTKALVRHGIVSWFSRTNPKGSKILIDCDIFPGNSGGPVFYFPVGMGSDGGFQFGTEIKFMGIVSQRRFSPTEVIGTKLISLESIGIGVVEPASRVRELLNEIESAIKN